MCKGLPDKGDELIGLTEDEVIEKCGKPHFTKDSKWEYAEHLGPGAHSHQMVTVLYWADGRVERVVREDRPIGCVLIDGEF